MKVFSAFVVAAIIACGGCASAVQGGPPLSLSSDLKNTATVRSIYVTNGSLDVDDDFTTTFSQTVLETIKG